MKGILLVSAVVCCIVSGGAQAQVQTFEPGTFGEIDNWLVPPAYRNIWNTYTRLDVHRPPMARDAQENTQP